MKVQQATHRQHGIQVCRHRSPHRSSSAHGYEDRGCETRFRSKHPRIHHCAIIWCRSTDSMLDVSTDQSSYDHPRSSAMPMRQHRQHRGYRPYRSPLCAWLQLSYQRLAVLPSPLPFRLLAASSLLGFRRCDRYHERHTAEQRVFPRHYTSQNQVDFVTLHEVIRT